jgi:tetratricopeptide (TPR) repeat protein
MSLIAAAWLMALAGTSSSVPLRAYVAGEYSQTLGDYASASRQFDIALKAVPDDVILQRKSFDTALAAGRMDEAVQLASRIAVIDPNVPPVNELLVVAAIRRGDWKGAEKQLSAMPAAGVDALLVPLMKSWAAQGRGSIDDARAALEPLSRNNSFAAFRLQQLAWLAVISKDWPAAKVAFSKLMPKPDLSAGTTNLLGYAATLAQLGDKAGARSLLTHDSDSRTPMRLLAARKQLDGTGLVTPPLQTPQHGMAAALSIVSSELVSQSIHGPAINMGQMARWLAPQMEEYQLILAETLNLAGRPDDAVTLLRTLSKGSATPEATVSLARMLADRDRKDESIVMLDTLARALPDRPEAYLALGDVKRANDDLAGSATAYDKALQIMGEPLHLRDWPVFFARAVAHEQSKNWDKAEADLKQALVLRPEDPTLLNYLGYTWLERGTNFDAASEMIAKALERRPGDGAIIDSLGWAEFLAGRHERAIQLLEQAIEAVPGDPTVNEHLGDAYWTVGRAIEARHRWQAAIESEPSKDQKGRLEAKLTLGLPAVAAKPGS